jgi:nitrite reductase/ring-hydroxylating ferredoxin subunit
MEKIANLKELNKGDSLYFEYQGEKAILIRTHKGDIVAYIAVCPHEKGGIEWDATLDMILCECHLSLFNAHDGSVYRHSSLFELNEGLTKIDVTVDDDNNVIVK